MRGDTYKVLTSKRMRNEAGERVTVENERTVRAWYFEQDRAARPAARPRRRAVGRTATPVTPNRVPRPPTPPPHPPNKKRKKQKKKKKKKEKKEKKKKKKKIL